MCFAWLAIKVASHHLTPMLAFRRHKSVSKELFTASKCSQGISRGGTLDNSANMKPGLQDRLNQMLVALARHKATFNRQGKRHFTNVTPSSSLMPQMLARP